MNRNRKIYLLSTAVLYVAALIYFIFALQGENRVVGILVYAVGAPIMFWVGETVQKMLSDSRK